MPSITKVLMDDMKTELALNNRSRSFDRIVSDLRSKHGMLTITSHHILYHIDH
jgi:hypothetical protein